MLDWSEVLLLHKQELGFEQQNSLIFFRGSEKQSGWHWDYGMGVGVQKAFFNAWLCHQVLT